jgi:hypothetical protein
VAAEIHRRGEYGLECMLATGTRCSVKGQYPAAPGSGASRLLRRYRGMSRVSPARLARLCFQERAAALSLPENILIASAVAASPQMAI